MSTNTIQTSCKQCGVCCTKGGAALHGADITLLSQGDIPRRDLITIRQGEFAHNPVSDTIVATKNEIIKLRGTSKEWTCCYYDPVSNGCRIYDNRPVACSTLKCWDPKESLELVETDLLSRFEILEDEKSLQELVQEYERTCPLPDFTSLNQELEKHPARTLEQLEASVNRDLEFRNRAVAASAQVLEEEMFLFGRPLFQLLQSFGLQVYQSGGLLKLKMNNTK